jgi:2-iminobutanoate/2-iminopropanoate deaminase
MRTRRSRPAAASCRRAGGSSLAQVLKCNVFLADMADFPAMNEVYARFFPAPNSPARATVAVAGLPRGARVEIDCVALVEPHTK